MSLASTGYIDHIASPDYVESFINTCRDHGLDDEATLEVYRQRVRNELGEPAKFAALRTAKDRLADRSPAGATGMQWAISPDEQHAAETIEDVERLVAVWRKLPNRIRQSLRKQLEAQTMEPSMESDIMRHWDLLPPEQRQKALGGKVADPESYDSASLAYADTTHRPALFAALDNSARR